MYVVQNQMQSTILGLEALQGEDSISRRHMDKGKVIWHCELWQWMHSLEENLAGYACRLVQIYIVSVATYVSTCDWQLFGRSGVTVVLKTLLSILQCLKWIKEINVFCPSHFNMPNNILTSYITLSFGSVSWNTHEPAVYHSSLFCSFFWSPYIIPL